MRRTKEERRRTAIHEAGHAVVACVLDLDVMSASIVANVEENEAGHVRVDDPWVTVNRWDQGGKSHRSYDTALRARVLQMMAGREAEVEVIGRYGGGDDHDQYWIGCALHDLGVDGIKDPDRWDKVEARMRRMARALVRRHRGKIERTAAALLERRRLTGKQLVRLVRA